MAFCAWRCLENLHPTQQGIVWNAFSLCFLNKSALCRRSSFPLRTSECWLILLLPRWRRPSRHPFCFLSVQRQAVRSCGARCREAQRQAWPWRWGTGWLARRAGSPPTAAWTATAPKESEWGRPPSAALRAPLSPLSQKPPHALRSALLVFTDLLWRERGSPATGIPGFLYPGPRSGDKMLGFNGKRLKGDFHNACN